MLVINGIFNIEKMSRKNFKRCGGMYDEESSFKIGYWTELSEEYDEWSQVMYYGEYSYGNKVGKWDILFRKDEQEPFQLIGGGMYDEEGSFKIGQWTELSDEFQYDQQIIYYGQYQNGKKINKWITEYEGEEIGGSYVGENSIKIGKWTELKDGFDRWSKAIYYGEYKNGQKVGKWEIWYRKEGNQQFVQIGGGFYNEEGSFKIGQWIEVSDEFGFDSQIIYYGQYQKGKKVGKWIAEYEAVKICGGSYGEGCSIKVGKWTELKDGFDRWSKVIYQGEYKNGQKVGLWDIFQWEPLKKQFELIGSGSYDEGSYIKIGRWNELGEGFRNNAQITCDGGYKNGKKIGKWNIKYQGINYGGGLYDEVDSVKIGGWIDLSESFSSSSQIFYKGEYKSGKKVGQWDIYYKKYDGAQKNELIGGGSYGEVGSIKIGRWIEECDGFNEYFQATYIGVYKNGEKVGRWDTFYRKEGQQQFKQIGGGLYDDVHSIKIGLWIELRDGFSKQLQQIYYNEFNNQNKEGNLVETDNKIFDVIHLDD